MLKAIICSFLVCAAFAVPAASAAPAAAIDEDLLNYVPADAQIVVNLRSVAELRQSVDGNAWGKFIRDPEVQALIDYWAEKMELTGGEDVDWKELSPLNLYEVVSGGMVLFMKIEGKDRYGGGVIVDPGEDRDDFDEFIDRVQEKLLDNEDLIDSLETYDGEEILVFEENEEEGDGAEGGESREFTLFHCDMEESMVLYIDASKEVGLEKTQKLIDSLKGNSSGECILDTALFMDTRKNAGGPALIECYADLSNLIALMIEYARSEEEIDAKGEAIIDALGLSDISAAYARAELGEGENLDGALYLGIEGEGALRGFADCLMNPYPRDMLKLMPKEAVALSAANIDINGIYTRIMDLIKAIDEQFYMQIRQGYDGMIKQRFGIDPENEILALLDGRIGSFNIKVSEEESPAAPSMFGGAPNMGALWVIGSKDAATFQTNFEQILRVFGLYVSLKTEEFQGQKLYSIALPGSTAQLSWTFSSDTIALSVSPSALRAFVRRVVSEDQPTALDRKDYITFLEMGTGSCAVSVSETATSIKSMIDVIEQLFNNPAFAVQVETEMDLSDMPPLPSNETVDKYFSGLSGIFVDVDEKGLNYRVAGR